MPVENPAHILLCTPDPGRVADVLETLGQLGYAVKVQTQKHLAEPKALLDLAIIDDVPEGELSPSWIASLRDPAAEPVLPLLFLVNGGAAMTRAAGLQAGADACLARPFGPDELGAQVAALVRIKRQLDRCLAKTSEFSRIHGQLEQAYRQLDLELELARRIQMSLLPREFPSMAPARFAVHYQPSGPVGGDFYDTFRLDEDHVGFYIADVVGHGVPASLLTIFLKKAVRTKEIHGHQYRLLPPEEVLAELNREMIAQALAENPFITMVYAIFDRRTNALTFSRAGHPYPLLLPRSGEPEFLEIHGTLLGVFETSFQSCTRVLEPGDKVLFYTDGIESGPEPSPSAWPVRLKESSLKYCQLSIEECVARLARELLVGVQRPDDFTLLGLEVAT